MDLRLFRNLGSNEGANEFGLNIEYLQADIIDLGQLFQPNLAI